MTWIYDQSSGNLTDPSGAVIGQGYSGNGSDLDNPAGQGDIGHGPIPQGKWMIGSFFNDPRLGPIVCHLNPFADNVMDGRAGGFMIHGDNEAENHTASDGCIVLAHELRQVIASSTDRTLVVT